MVWDEETEMNEQHHFKVAVLEVVGNAKKTRPVALASTGISQSLTFVCLFGGCKDLRSRIGIRIEVEATVCGSGGRGQTAGKSGFDSRRRFP